ncbi:GntR family regulatory protein [Mycobacteroides abscessus M94]|nr:GntR family regulatory protein [Mycobacteroides abscessus M94]
MVTIGSMSKSFWGGMRVGWIRADRTTIARLAAVRSAMDTGTPILEQLAAAELLERAEEVEAAQRETLRARRALVVSELHRRLPEWELQEADGGLWAVYLGPAAGTDEHRTCRRSRAPRGPHCRRTTVWGRRIAGALCAGAVHTARRSVVARRGTARPGLAHRYRRTPPCRFDDGGLTSAHRTAPRTCPNVPKTFGHARARKGQSSGMSTRRTPPSTASAASISARVMPRMNSTTSRYGWLTEASATLRNAGLALKATPRPAADSMSISFAPSPTATVCASGTPASYANCRNALALPGRSTTSPITLPVSLPSTISRTLAATKSRASSWARGSITWRNPPETTPHEYPSRRRVRMVVRAPGVSTNSSATSSSTDSGRPASVATR